MRSARISCVCRRFRSVRSRANVTTAVPPSQSMVTPATSATMVVPSRFTRRCSSGGFEAGPGHQRGVDKHEPPGARRGDGLRRALDGRGRGRGLWAGGGGGRGGGGDGSIRAPPRAASSAPGGRGGGRVTVRPLPAVL